MVGKVEGKMNERRTKGNNQKNLKKRKLKKKEK